MKSLLQATALLGLLAGASVAGADVALPDFPRRPREPAACNPQAAAGPREECVECLSRRSSQGRCAGLTARYGFALRCEENPQSASVMRGEVWCRQGQASPLPEEIRQALGDADRPDPLAPAPAPTSTKPRWSCASVDASTSPWVILLVAAVVIAERRRRRRGPPGLQGRIKAEPIARP